LSKAKFKEFQMTHKNLEFKILSSYIFQSFQINPYKLFKIANPPLFHIYSTPCTMRETRAQHHSKKNYPPSTKGCRVPPNHMLENRKKKKPTKHRLQTGTTKTNSPDKVLRPATKLNTYHTIQNFP
jgi:hypothetical protein